MGVRGHALAVGTRVPYRIRVLQAMGGEDDQLLILNHALREPERFHGAVNDAERRDAIRSDDLHLLEGCTYVVREQGDGFVGEVEPGCRCMVERKGRTA